MGSGSTVMWGESGSNSTSVCLLSGDARLVPKRAKQSSVSDVPF